MLGDSVYNIEVLGIFPCVLACHVSGWLIAALTDFRGSWTLLTHTGSGS